MLVEFILNEVLPWPDDNKENQRYDLKILDPACGSGIFLVESYKRLIARWKSAHPNKEISENVLTALLRDSIYGIEKNPEAIKVTAFSLYLTLLNYLEPKKVLDQVKFEPLIGWKDKNIREHLEQRQGNNLFQSSTFNKELIDINKTEFDLIIGNPPWKSGKLDSDVTDYCKKNKLPAQIACAYLHFMPQLAPKGIVALIGTAKILFNTGSVHEMFRKHLFTENRVEVVVNFSVVRDILFKNASTPGAVFIYKKRDGSIDVPFRDTVTYCVPKNIEIIRNRQTIVVDASEIKYLPVGEIIKEKSKIFKVAMWGSVRDLKLIENKIRIVNPISDFISKEEWGVGLKIKDFKAPSGNEHLTKYLLLPTEKLNKYYTTTNNIEHLKSKHLTFRTNNKKIFDAPLILVKEGTKDSEFCCSYIDTNLTFLSSVLGISIKSKNANFHKALVACLNSTIATYYFFLTGSLWGVDRGGQILKTETMTFPALPFAMEEKTINQLSEKIDELINIKKSNNLIIIQNEKSAIRKIQKEIDDVIYRELKLNSNEIAIVNDVLNFSIALHNKYKDSGAECPVSPEKEITTYSKTLIKTINTFFKGTKRSTRVEIIDGKKQNDTFRIIALHFDADASKANSVDITSHSISTLLKLINGLTYQTHSESIYYRKVIKYYKKDVVYLIKPNQKRFWGVSQALNDADDILTDLLNKWAVTWVS